LRPPRATLFPYPPLFRSPVPEPHLVAWNPGVAELLGLPEDSAADPDLLPVLAGNTVLPGMAPLAAIYAGHQFGVWVPQLGDGRRSEEHTSELQSRENLVC